MKPYTINAVKFTLHLTWCAVKEFSALRFKTGMLLCGMSSMAFSMRHLTKASAAEVRAALFYRFNRAYNECDLSAIKGVSTLIAMLNEVTRERWAENNK